MRYSLSIRMNIQDDNVILDSNGGRNLCFDLQLIFADFVIDCTTFVGFSRGASREFLVGVNDGSLSCWIFDILDSNRDSSTNDLFHCKWMDHLGTVICQFGSFIGGDDGYKSCGWDFTWVGSEDAVYFFPDLQLGSFQANGTESSTEIRVSSTNLGE